MARCPIVAPQVTRVTLRDGEFLDLKAELNAGEYRKMLAGNFSEHFAGEKPRVDLDTFGITVVLAYVVGWSFVDMKDQPLAFSKSALLMLDQDTFSEIREACEAHHEASEKAAAERKNARTGASTYSKT